MSTKVLYVVGSLGMGHVIRDLAIANALRKKIPDVDMTWLAPHPASIAIEQAGEKLHADASLLANDTEAAEEAAKTGFKLNIQEYTMKAMGAWEQNVKAFQQIVSKESFDLVIADESYEIAVALGKGEVVYNGNFVMLYDFFGNVAMSWNPMEQIGTHMWNQEWAKTPDTFNDPNKMAIFLGELDDIQNKRMGLFLPNARTLASQVCQFVGYVLSFDPAEFQNVEEMKSKLGYGLDPLIICSIGGTAVGVDLLTLCGQAYELVKKTIPNLRMVIVTGPRLPVDSISVPDGVDVKGYVPDLYQHFAACDLAIVQAGGTTTLELTALRRPFIYFPLEGHFEQQVHVAHRINRHQAGFKMAYKDTSPTSLAEAIITNISQPVRYNQIRTDGAERTASLIKSMIE